MKNKEVQNDQRFGSMGFRSMGLIEEMVCLDVAIGERYLGNDSSYLENDSLYPEVDALFQSDITMIVDMLLQSDIAYSLFLAGEYRRKKIRN